MNESLGMILSGGAVKYGNPYRVEVTPENILGVLSIIIRSLIIVVSVKYVAIVMKADNRCEGGILSLMALLVSGRNKDPRSVVAVFALGTFGAALLFGDGMITPAISVLSAVEGLAVVTPIFAPYTLPLSLAILPGLFGIQKRRTARIGAAFGPVMVAWFIILSILGLFRILDAPEVLAAFNPYFAIHFFLANRLRGFFLLVDCAFLGFSLLKIRQGGWIPLVIAMLAYGLMDGWNHGITKLLRTVSSQSVSVAVFLSRPD